MPYTAPNQKVITINRKPLGGNFLGINNENWKYAARVLGAHAFLLYIYFASNKDDFKLALSENIDRTRLFIVKQIMLLNEQGKWNIKDVSHFDFRY